MSNFKEYPLMAFALGIWTFVVIGLVALAMVTAAGEDVMGLPIVFALALAATVPAWVVFGLWSLFT